MTRTFVRRAMIAAVLALPGLVSAAGFQDVLETPARETARASRAALSGIARAGNRLVAVGQRGVIIWSDDQGATWTQAKVPVSSDLVAVHFPSIQKGWAVGHFGVVLHTQDAGASWARQLDGQAAGRLALEYYRSHVPEGVPPGPPRERFMEDVARFTADGVNNSILDVWFEDELNGFIVGTFNLIFRTVDGGTSWVPWLDRTENPKAGHLYAIRRVGQDVVIVGEQGLVLKLDRTAGHFRALKVPYGGTLFGVSGAAGKPLVFGLRGNAFRSHDAGATWERVETGVTVGLTGGVEGRGGRLYLLSGSGHLLESTDQGGSFRSLAVERPSPFSSIAEAQDGSLVLVGLLGVTKVPHDPR